MKLERSVAINLLIVAAAIGSSVALIATLQQPTSAEAAARANNLLPHFPRDSLRTIRIQSAKAAYTLQRRAASDAKTAEFELEADHSPTDPEAVESLLRALELGGYLRRFDGGASPEFGFASPRLELSLEFGTGHARLRIGKMAVTPANASYVQVQRRLGASATEQSGFVAAARAVALRALRDRSRARQGRRASLRGRARRGSDLAPWCAARAA